MGLTTWRFRTLWGLCLALLGTSLWAATGERRAKPPRWTGSVERVFFPDAREALTGERPAAGSAPVIAGGGNSDGGGDSPAAVGGVFTWSKLIGPEELEDEIKTLQKQVSETVTTPTVFAGGVYKTARREFTELAVLFAIIGEYDGDVRWKKDAAEHARIDGSYRF